MLLPLQNSPFLLALGWAIANSIWQCGILWGLYHVCAGFNFKVSSRFKNTLSTGLVFVGFAWFVQTFIAKIISVKPATEFTYNEIDAINLLAVTSNHNFESLLSALKSSLPYFSVAYIFLLCILFFKFFKAYQTSLFIRRYGIVPALDEWQTFTANAASRIRVNKKLSIWFSTYINVPATVGFLKPVILIPVAALNQLTTDQLEAIILHELAHIKRNDYLVNILISVIETILFFNPFIVLMIKILKRERENCCDDFVIDYKYDRHSYASALVSIEKTRLTNYQLAISATSGKNQLLERVKRIVGTGEDVNNFNYGQKLLALLIITAIMFSVSWVYPYKQEYSAAQPKTKRTEIKPAFILNHTHVIPDSFHYSSKNKPSLIAMLPDLNKVSSPVKSPEQVIISPSLKEVAEHNETREFENAEKTMPSLDELRALINNEHPGVKLENDFEFTFNTDLASIKQDIDRVNWNHVFNEQDFESYNPAVLDNEIRMLVEQAKSLTTIKKRLEAKESLLKDLPELYQKKEIEWNKNLNKNIIFENLERFKMDSLLHEKFQEINISEEPMMRLETPHFKKVEKQIIENVQIRHQQFKPFKATVPARARTFKKVNSTVNMPVSIDFNGNHLVVDNTGIRIKKSLKTSKKNLKKLILAFGKDVVHVNLED